MEREGFEPSPNSLQDCRSAELSYHPKNKHQTNWLRRRDLNPRTFAYEANALPPELLRKVNERVAGLAGLEPARTRLEDERSCPSELQTRICEWRRQRESNPQPAVYETAALPVGATSPKEKLSL